MRGPLPSLLALGRWSQKARALIGTPGETRRILANSAWLLWDYALRFSISLGLGMWFARTAGPQAFGTSGTATALVGLYSGLSTLGLETVAVRDLVKEPGARREILSTAVGLRLGGGLVTILLALATAALTGHAADDTAGLVLIAGVALLPQALQAIDFAFQAEVDSRQTVLARNTAFLVASAVKALVLWFHRPVQDYLAVATLEAVLVGAAYLVLLKRRKGTLVGPAAFRVDRAKAWARDCAPLTVSLLLIAVYRSSDRAFLAYAWSSAEVAAYNVGTQLVEVLYVVPAVISSSIYPRLTRAHQEGDAAFDALQVRLMAGLFWAGVAACLAMQLVAAPGVTLLFGAAYRDAIPVMQVQALNLPFVFANAVFLHRYALRGEQTRALWGNVAGAVASLALNSVLVPAAGGVGAAAASFFAYWAPAVTLSVLVDPSIGRTFVRAILVRPGPAVTPPRP